MGKKKLYKLSILMLFIGYIVGRIGHVLWGKDYGIHHWIYGIGLMGIGIISAINYNKHDDISFLIILFGTGLIISDLNDMLNFRVIDADGVISYNFLGVD